MVPQNPKGEATTVGRPINGFVNVITKWPDCPPDAEKPEPRITDASTPTAPRMMRRFSSPKVTPGISAELIGPLICSADSVPDRLAAEIAYGVGVKFCS